MKTQLSRSALFLSTMALLAASFFVQAANNPIKRPAKLANSKLHLTPLPKHAQAVEVFVRLDEPSVAELNIESVKATGAMAPEAAQKAQASRVSAQQGTLRAQLESLGARILSTQRVGANGFRVSVPANRLTSLRGVVGVRSVGQVRRHKLDHVESVPWIGAPSVWTALSVKGTGIKVGVIDSGIDYLHANFGGSGNPADYAADDPNVVEPNSFPTAKVVGGYDFAGASYDADSDDDPVPDNDPIDHGGHGTHVAGTVAGIGVAGSIGPGVAPEAELYALKVFGDGGGTTGLTSLAIEWAMDPNGDGDMSDRLDVINMSLGAAFGDPNDPSAISAGNAAELGIIVVASAGNEGATPYVTGAPALAPAVISTAASIPGGRVHAKLTITAPASVAGVKPVVEGAGPVTLARVGSISDAIVPGVPANGCASLTNAGAIANRIVLIARGTCTFVEKYRFAQAAGARAIVVYNNTAADPIIMGIDDPTIKIPGVMTTQAVGLSLAATPGVTGRLEALPDPSKDDRISDFSSLGPGQMDSSFKPDLTAPGESIVSAEAGSGTGASTSSGTSMAAPHVAGAAALLRQLHPKLDQSAIKALLQNSTVNANASFDTSLTRQGVGVIRVDRAAALTSYAAPGGISFGRINPLLPVWKTEKITLRSITNGSRNFSVTHVPNRSLPGVQVSCPANTYVRGKHPAHAFISLKFDPQASAAAGVADDGVVSQSEVDGWCVFKDGKDELRVGYIAVVDPASSVLVTPTQGHRGVTVRNLGPALGWAEAFTLAKLGGEELDRKYNAIAALGFRRADRSLYEANVLELGLATERPFTHPSNLIVDILIDTDGNGEPDGELLALDLSLLDPNFDPGIYVTAQIDAAGDAFIDWEVRSYDFNDRVITLPFTFASDGGVVPEKFNYTLYVINGNDNTEDVQSGVIDMSREIVPDLNSFGIEQGDKIDITMTGKGTSLWLLQNNPALGQVGISVTK